MERKRRESDVNKINWELWYLLTRRLTTKKQRAALWVYNERKKEKQSGIFSLITIFVSDIDLYDLSKHYFSNGMIDEISKVRLQHKPKADWQHRHKNAMRLIKLKWQVLMFPFEERSPTNKQTQININHPKYAQQITDYYLPG